MSKKIIITQKQLDEIVGGNASYLDNLGSDFRTDGVNSVYTGEKYGDRDCEPTTADKVGRQLRRDAGFYSLSRANAYRSPLFYEEKINEDNSNLVNNTYGDDKNRVSNTNASTLKWRYGAAKKKAQSTDPTIRQQGISTMKTMEKNNPNLKQIETQYNAAMANDANIKKTRHDRGEENVYQKPGYTRNTDGFGNEKQVITYESKINEGKSIKSQKLLSILRAHGGIYKNKGMHKPYPLTNAELDNITDDRVLGVVDWSDIDTVKQNIIKNGKYGFVPGDDIDSVRLMDDKYVLLLVKNASLSPERENEPNTFKDTWNKFSERQKNKVDDGAKFYRWKSKDAQDLAFNNPYYSEWSDETKQQLRNKIKNDYKKQ